MSQGFFAYPALLLQTCILLQQWSRAQCTLRCRNGENFESPHSFGWPRSRCSLNTFSERVAPAIKATITAFLKSYKYNRVPSKTKYSASACNVFLASVWSSCYFVLFAPVRLCEPANRFRCSVFAFTTAMAKIRLRLSTSVALVFLATLPALRAEGN